jgi:hypothetical protein
MQNPQLRLRCARKPGIALVPGGLPPLANFVLKESMALNTRSAEDKKKEMEAQRAREEMAKKDAERLRAQRTAADKVMDLSQRSKGIPAASSHRCSSF